MRKLACTLSLLFVLLPATTILAASAKDPTWWDKYLYILNNGSMPAAGATTSLSSGLNVDVFVGKSEIFLE